jgi:hypothetical protein
MLTFFSFKGFRLASHLHCLFASVVEKRRTSMNFVFQSIRVTNEARIKLESHRSLRKLPPLF